MQKFNFSYDEGNDDLFIYKAGAKSSGSIEIGNLVLDFSKSELVAIQLLDASRFLSDLTALRISKKMLAKLKDCNVEVISRNNQMMIRFALLIKGEETIKSNITIPKVVEKSPALAYA